MNSGDKETSFWNRRDSLNDEPSTCNDSSRAGAGTGAGAGAGVKFRPQYAFADSPASSNGELSVNRKQANVEPGDRSEETEKKAAFDDVLKFGAYSVVLTIFYFIMSISLTAQLLFMVFGGARPEAGKLLCSYGNGTTTETEFGFTRSECKQLVVLDGNNATCKIKATYKYGSIYEQFHLECHPHYGQRSTAYQNIGMVLGAITGGILANNFGRKKTLIWFAVLLATFAFGSILAPTAAVFTLTRLFVMFFVAGLHNVTGMYYIENLPLKWRSIMPTLVSYSLTYIVFAFIAFFCREWKTLTFVSSCFVIASIIILVFLEETPSFLFSRTVTGCSLQNQPYTRWTPKLSDMQQNNTITFNSNEKIEQRYRMEAKKAAKRIDTFFCTKGSPDFDKKWREAAIYYRRRTIANQQLQKSKVVNENEDAMHKHICPSFYKLFNNVELKTFTLVIAFCLFTNSVVNYGVLLGVDRLQGAIWFNIAITGVLRYIVNFSTIAYEFICGKLKHPLWAGRRPIHLICASCVTVFLTVIVLLDTIGDASQMKGTWKWAKTIIVWLVISMCNQMFIIHQVQSSETFPTPIRALGCGIVQSANRLGSAAGPFILSLAGIASFAPHAIMLALFVMDLTLYSFYSFRICGNKLCAIKETKGRPKPEFMPGEDNEQFLKTLQSTHLSIEEYAALGESAYTNIDLDDISTSHH